MMETTETDKTCRRLPGTEETLRFVSDWFWTSHVRAAMDERFVSDHYTVYHLMDDILKGDCKVYGVFETKDDLCLGFDGLVFGWIDKDGYYECHLAFSRYADAVDCAKMIEAVLREENPGVRGIVGYIPDRNRAARMFAKRYGCKDNGLRRTMLFYKEGAVLPCREFRKDF